jgi:hypothetical protein
MKRFVEGMDRGQSTLFPECLAVARLLQVLHYRTEEEMDAIPLEVWSAFVAVAAGGLLLVAGYIIKTWRK